MSDSAQAEIAEIIQAIKAAKDSEKHALFDKVLQRDRTFATKVFLTLIQLADLDRQTSLDNAFYMVDLYNEDIIEPLIVILKENPNSKVLVQVCDAIEWLKDSRAVEALLTLLEENNNPQVQAGACAALGRLKDLRAVEPLIKMLQSDDLAVRTASATSLSYLKDQRAVEPLLALYDKSEGAEKDSLSNALAEFDDPRLLHPLLELEQNQSIISENGRIVES